MSRPQVRKLFSAHERSFISQQNVGKPTGVTVEVGGFVFDLVPLTTSQASMVLDIMDSIPELRSLSQSGDMEIAISRMLELASERGRDILALLRKLLLKSAKANGLINVDDDGLAVFNDWFDELELRATLITVIAPVLAANGLGTLLGNAQAPETPAQEQTLPMAAAAT